jgi:flavin reductase (DIM6/NTAB) family NADH-FMN oxidoreductase RutF
MKLCKSPQHGWKPGDPVQSPVSEMVSLDPASLDSTACYKLLIGTIVPRPIAFVTTLSDNGKVNAAPFSAFNLVTSKPTSVVFSVAIKPSGEKKDTLKNIERSKEFVINTVSDWMVESMNYCSGEFPYGVSELEVVGLSTVPSEAVAPPRIKESAVHMECRVHTLVPVGAGAPGSATVVIGEVVRFHIHKPAFYDGKIDIEKLRPVSRLGGLRYGAVGDVFELDRPKI